MPVNRTEIFPITIMDGDNIHLNNDNELSGDDKVQTSTHIPMAMTLQVTPPTSSNNRLHNATDGGSAKQPQHQFIVPNESMETSFNGSTINVTSSFRISNKSSHDNNNRSRNSSNTSFSNIKFATMKPCKGNFR